MQFRNEYGKLAWIQSATSNGSCSLIATHRNGKKKIAEKKAKERQPL